jgi:EpsI family protein
MNNLVSTSSPTLEDSGVLRVHVEGKRSHVGEYHVLLRLIGLGIPLTLLCAPSVRDLSNMFWTMHGGGHGFLLFLISLYLAWFKWHTLRHLPVAPALGHGASLLILATLLLIASQVGGVITTSALALILILAGLFLLLAGHAYLKALAFPLVYLMIFMTPVLGSLIELLKRPAQLLTATVSASLLKVLGIPTLLEKDIHIVMPTVTFEVAEECSGVGILIAVLAIGLPLAYVILHRWWNRVALIVSSVIVAMIVNWIRVTIMGAYAHWGGTQLHGPYHILGGLFLDSLAFAYLVAAAWLLSKLENTTPALTREERPTVFSVPWVEWNRACWVGSITLLTGAIVLYAMDRDTAPVKEDLETFPLAIGDWIIDETQKSESILNVPNVDSSLLRTYRGPDGQRVSLYIVHMDSQRQGKELVNVTTAPLHERAAVTDLWVKSTSMPLNRTVVGKHEIPALFWYRISGMSYANRYVAKLATIKQAFLHGHTAGSFVLIYADPQTDPGYTQWKRQKQFAGLIYPLLADYLP